MSCYVGMDIGAVSLTAALLFKGQAQPTEWEDNGFRRYAGSLTGFEALYLSEYGRTRGKPLAAATALLEHVIGLLGTEGIAGLCLTGSGAKLAAQELGAPVTNEFQAIAAGLAASGLEVRTVFEMGGESSKYLRLSAAENGGYSIIDYATNGDCAAGTGAFIDQQAGRLQYAVEEVGPIVLSAQRAAQVAGRCSVFAKSDMIHAQQKGYSPAEVLGGLCDAVARNFRTAVVRSHPVEEPVALIGGVAANEAVVRAMGEAFGLTDGRLVVPEMFSYIPAIGAAVAAAGEGVFDPAGVERLRASSDSGGEKFPVCQPLSLDSELVGADTINDEITAHKTGATFIGKTMLDGKVPDTIFEIGGQDSKYISLQDEIVVDFTMNDACAAGTGSFLEERAEELDIAIKDQFAEMALSSRAPIRLGERCTVFMERDVNSYLQRGADKPDLVAGLAYSVVYNYINRVVRGRRIGECIFFQGGTAYNDAVAAAFAGVLGKEIIVPPHNGVIGAIGAALLARDKMAAVADGTGPGAGVEEVEEVDRPSRRHRKAPRPLEFP